jgi:NTP pyrophosphatase (non-canonical NTP hydrolase)
MMGDIVDIQNKVLEDLEEAIHNLIRSLRHEPSLLLRRWHTAINVVVDICSDLSLSVVDIFEKKMSTNKQNYPIHTTGTLQIGTDRIMVKHSEIQQGPRTYSLAPQNRSSKSAKHDLLANEEALHELLFEFSNNRNWIQYYDNRGLSLSLLSELGEVCAALEYCKNGPVSNNVKENLAEELADVTIYLFHVARVNKLKL